MNNEEIKKEELKTEESIQEVESTNKEQLLTENKTEEPLNSVENSAEEVKIFEEKKEEIVEIYTDGACSGNPGPGGWAAVLLFEGNEKRISGGEKLTTNNKMELMAAIEGLKAITRKDIKIKLYTDSTYVQKGMSEWLFSWKQKQFKDVKNVEMWKELDALSSELLIEWHWVKAHAGNKYNEIADSLARGEALKNK